MRVSYHNIQSKLHGGSAERLLAVSGSAGRGKAKGPQATTEDILGERFLERFAVFVDKSPRPRGCWLWTAGVDAHGYGQIARLNGRSPMKAHRAAWMLVHGPITSAQHVLHRCDTPRCVNPAHLFLGDQAANMKDAAAKGRLSTAHPNSRTLSVEGEQEIKAIYAANGGRLPMGTRGELARRFGISKGYLSMLGRGRRERIPMKELGR